MKEEKSFGDYIYLSIGILVFAGGVQTMMELVLLGNSIPYSVIFVFLVVNIIILSLGLYLIDKNK